VRWGRLQAGEDAADAEDHGPAGGRVAVEHHAQRGPLAAQNLARVAVLELLQHALLGQVPPAHHLGEAALRAGQLPHHQPVVVREPRGRRGLQRGRDLVGGGGGGGGGGGPLALATVNLPNRLQTRHNGLRPVRRLLRREGHRQRAPYGRHALGHGCCRRLLSRLLLLLRWLGLDLLGGVRQCGLNHHLAG